MDKRYLTRVSFLAALLLWPAGLQAQTSVRLAPPTGPIISGTKVCGASAEAIVTGATTALAVVLRNASLAETILLGGSVAQALTLQPGQSVAFDIPDLQQVYCMRGGSQNATLEYFAVKGP